ncbi:hypothetical protein BJF82_00760 [Kytococcus sp. CUA-901]|nr:hypothetical protein BJF82_00760 [Kytococcus sp. CUA-901]
MVWVSVTASVASRPSRSGTPPWRRSSASRPCTIAHSCRPKHPNRAGRFAVACRMPCQRSTACRRRVMNAATSTVTGTAAPSRSVQPAASRSAGVSGRWSFHVARSPASVRATPMPGCQRRTSAGRQR